MLTLSNMAKVQTQEIKAGHSYFMGSSSSPSLVIVLAVEDQRVMLVKPHGETMKSYTLDRASANIAIRNGGQTVRVQAENTPAPYNKSAIARAALHGAPANPRDYDIYHVEVRPVAGVWDSSENWHAAEEYGNVGGDTQTKLLEIDMCRGVSLAALVKDKRFVVVSMKLIKECGT